MFLLKGLRFCFYVGPYVLKQHICFFQVVRAKNVETNPNWTGNVEDANNVALITIPKSGNVAVPTLADATLNLYPNTIVHGVRIEYQLEMDPFAVVAKRFCPQIFDRSEGMCCAYSKGKTLQTGKSALTHLQWILCPFLFFPTEEKYCY